MGEKKRKYHHGNLREALIDAALELIEEAEPYKFTLREAARRAGVAASAPYRHFENKAALLAAIAEEGTSRMFAMMAEEMEKVEEPQAAFRAMGVAFVKFAVAHPGYFRVLHMPEHVRPELTPHLQETNKQNAQMLSALFGQMQEGGSLASGAPMLQFLAAQAMTYGLARMFVDGQLSRLGIDEGHAEALAHAVTGVLGVGLAPRREEDEQIQGALEDMEAALHGPLGEQLQKLWCVDEP